LLVGLNNKEERMLQKYSIMPHAIILFLFGLTLITVSPVFAEDSAEFIACQQIKPAGDFKLMKQKKNCFRDVARLSQGQSGDSIQPVAPTDPSGGEVAQLNARIAESESQVATLTTTNTQLQEQLRSASAAKEPLNARIAELEAENAKLLAQQGAPADPTSQKMVRQRDGRIRSLTQVLRSKMRRGHHRNCETEVLKQRDTREWRRACDKDNQGFVNGVALCDEQRKLEELCYERIGVAVEEWLERFQGQLSRIQHYDPIDGEANIIACPKCP